MQRKLHRTNDCYRPSDDTFLLADSLPGKAGGSSALEIGAGSGYISELLSQSFGRVVATDVSIEALREAKVRAEGVDFVCCDSCSAMSNVSFDLIVMNPPYLPSPDGMTTGDRAVDGGSKGIEVTLKLVRDSLPLLSSDGRMLIVTSSLADHAMLVRKLGEMGLQVSATCSKKVGLGEELMVFEGSFTPYAARLYQSPSAENPSPLE